MTYGLTVVAFTGCGWWLDGHFGTSPRLLLAGALLGGVGGFVSLLKKVPPPGGGSKGDDT
jgi:F0F1-type ATP synthase assembly protein I